MIILNKVGGLVRISALKINSFIFILLDFLHTFINRYINKCRNKYKRNHASLRIYMLLGLIFLVTENTKKSFFNYELLWATMTMSSLDNMNHVHIYLLLYEFIKLNTHIYLFLYLIVSKIGNKTLCCIKKNIILLELNDYYQH